MKEENREEEENFEIDEAEKEEVLNSQAIKEEIKKKEQENLTFSHSDEPAVKKPVKRRQEKVNRNDLCPCGSGKKYKKCCMP